MKKSKCPENQTKKETKDITENLDISKYLFLGITIFLLVTKSEMFPAMLVILFVYWWLKMDDEV